MRLWHKDLIPVLPKHQLLSQWRECCCIAKNIAEDGTPNHLLVNKILDYPFEHFFTYGMEIVLEMTRRGYKVNGVSVEHFRKHCLDYDELAVWFVPVADIFPAWHNDKYFLQCYYNLEEKHDCGGIPDKEWKLIEKLFANRRN